MPTPLPTKPCVVCGRTITWRKKWERDWEHVRYCSNACRKRGVQPIDAQLEQAIRTLLDRRQHNATICPSEVARHVGSETTWRDLMEPTRQAARRLVASGEVVILQRNQVVDPSTAKGPIRIGRASR